MTPQRRRDVIVRRAVVGTVIVVTAVVYLWPALAGLRTFAATDILQHAAPYRESILTEGETGNSLQHDQMAQVALVAEFWETLRSGRVQLWEPDNGGGMPMFTGVHNRALTPFFATFLVTPLPLAPTVAVLLAFVVAQLGAYGLGRRLGLSWPAALVAAVAYAYSGPVTVFVLRINEVFLFPAVLWAIHGAMTDPDRRGRFLAVTSLLFAGVWFSGFPAAGYFIVYTSAAFALVLGWQLTSDRLRAEPAGAAPGREGAVRATWRRVGAYGRGWVGAVTPPGLAVLAGTAIAMVQLLPTFEYMLAGGDLGRRIPLHYRAGLAKLSTTVSGRFFGTKQGEDDWWSPQVGFANPVEAQSTVGLVPIGLMTVVFVAGIVALWSLVRRRRRRHGGPSAPAQEETAPHPAEAGAVRPGQSVPSEVRRDDPGRIAATFLLPAALVITAAMHLGGTWLAIVQLLPFMETNSVGRARFVSALAFAVVAGWGLDILLRRRPTTPRQDAYRLVAAVQLLLLGAGLVIGLRTAIGWALTANAQYTVRDALLVPLGALVVGALFTTVLLRTARGGRTVAIGLVLAVLAAVELQWGAWGFTPASPPELFYPDHAAVDRIRDEVGAGGDHRFVSFSGRVLPPHTAARLDVSDVRAEFPVFGPYHDLLVALDPGQAGGDVRVIPEPHFDDRTDLDSRVLDAMSAGLFIQPLDDDPWEPGDRVSTELDGGELPLEREIEVPEGRLRGISLEVLPIDDDCRTGWVELETGGTTTRRLARDLHDTTWFHLPDLLPDETTTTFRLTTTHCPAELQDGDAIAVVAEDGALPLRSVDGWQVFERGGAHPRAALAAETVTIEDPSQRIAYLVTRAEDDPVILSAETEMLGVEPEDAPDGESGQSADGDERGGVPSTSPSPSPTPEEHADGTVSFLHDASDRVELGVEADGASVLVLRDVAAPGWRVAVDGEPAELLIADHAFRAVEVPAGRSTVTFTYRPTSLWIGLAASLVGVALTVVLTRWGYGRRTASG
jgi:hypothetical protein